MFHKNSVSSGSVETFKDYKGAARRRNPFSPCPISPADIAKDSIIEP